MENKRTYGQKIAQDFSGIADILLGRKNQLPYDPNLIGNSLAAIQGGLNTPIGENPLSGAAFNVAKKVALSPFQEGVKKALKTFGEKKALQEVQNGVDPRIIEEQVGLSPKPDVPPQQGVVNTPQSPLSNQQSGQNQGGGNSEFGGISNRLMNQQPQGGGAGDYLQTLLTIASGGIIPTPGFQRTLQRNAESLAGGQARAQALATNEIPISLADRQKLQIQYAGEAQKKDTERMDNFFKEINQPLSTQKDLSFVEGALTGVDDITNLLGISMDDKGTVSIKNEGLLKDPNPFGAKRQELKRARDVFINKALRRDTGATIGKEEEKQFKDTFGFDIGMGAFKQNPKVVAKSILQVKNQLLRDRANLSPNQKIRDIVGTLRSEGFKDKDIYAKLKDRGLV